LWILCWLHSVFICKCAMHLVKSCLGYSIIMRTSQVALVWLMWIPPSSVLNKFTLRRKEWVSYIIWQLWVKTHWLKTWQGSFKKTFNPKNQFLTFY
jgi:hypothetical protein